MARIGVRCIRGCVSDEDCRSCMMEPLHPCGFPPELLTLMLQHEDDGMIHSPSRVLNCNRRQVLMDGSDYFLNVDTEYASLRGTLMHSGIETLGIHPTEVIKESRITTMVDTAFGPQPFSAKADCIVFLYEHMDEAREYDRVVHVKIRDYKTTGLIEHTMVAAEKKHQMQVNMYAYMVTREAGQYFGGKVKVVVDELEINYLGANKARRFTSAGSLPAVGKKPRGAEEAEMLTLEPIHLLPMEQVEKFIRARIEKRIRERDAGLPPVLEGEEAKWCFRCPVFGACRGAMGSEEAE